MSKNILFWFVLTLCAVCLASCEKTTDVNEMIDLTGGGYFTVFCIDNTNGLTITRLTLKGKSFQTIDAHRGNIVRIRFVPDEKYESYSFDTKFILPTNTVINNQEEYEYAVPESLEGSYLVRLNANSSGQDESHVWNIGVSDDFTLNIIQ